MDAHAKWAGRQRLELAAKALTKHGFSTVVVETKEEAAAKVLEMIPAGAKVGIGGSITVRELGLVDALGARGNTVYQHWKPGLTREEEMAIRRAQLTSDVFLASSNAVTLSGELVNIDGVGNRVASEFFGPGKIILIAGVNKITKDVTDGIWRTRNIAAPANGHRLNIKTPCGVAGYCNDCDSPERFCRVLVVLERQPSRSDITVVLVNEDLGY
jgi:L-lactate utilization protein LutB